MVCLKHVIVAATLILWLHLLVIAMSPTDTDAKEEGVEEHLEEDMSWWIGAEDIDLTLQSEDNTTTPSDYSEVSCFWDMDCDSFSDYDLPADFMEFIPPPPIPPFLEKLGAYAQERLQKEQKLESKIVLKSKQNFHSNCSFCDWAHQNNTGNIFLTRKDSKYKFGEEMVLVVIGVGILSTVLGASCAAVLIRCRKLKFYGIRKGLWLTVMRGLKLKDTSGDKEFDNSTCSLEEGVQSSNRLWALGHTSPTRVPLNVGRSSSRILDSSTRCESPYISRNWVYSGVGYEEPGHPLNYANPCSGITSLPESTLPESTPGFENGGYVPSEAFSADLSQGEEEESDTSQFVSNDECYLNNTKKHAQHSDDTNPSLELTSAVTSNEIALRPIHYLPGYPLYNPNIHPDSSTSDEINKST